MYRFSIDKEDWILRFSPNIQVPKDVQLTIVNWIIQLGNLLPSYAHGQSFLIKSEEEGIIVFNVEKVPSLILTVSNIIPKEKCFHQKGKLINHWKW
ncbi:MULTISPECIES: hypothetical protein [Robertmurraya]|jgi:hypothetical protein|uniref:LAGLIDADG homing endonuclease n=1 Tax=Robertmurraya beringensis TaxID=641660 RepID=A0ABV6KXF6_9BACI|nr:MULTISPECIES: hypothetical protein [Bacillaceae]AYA76770.1 hypothetical protein DOE78_15700 [Bacillus sp. Y1]MCM3599855.1 hypothetical protein [Robertmurraya korlensis]